jgi:pyruvate carboxylase
MPLRFSRLQAPERISPMLRQSYGDVDVLPTPQFFYGMKSGEEIAIEIEPGKTLIVKFLTLSEVHPDGTRTVFFELNG